MGLTTKQQSRLETLFKAYATLATSFLLALFVASVFFPVMPSSALTCTDGSTGATGQICRSASSTMNVQVNNPYYVTVSSSAGSGSGVALDYTSSSGNKLGDVIAASDTVTTTSNTGRPKYLYISTTSSSNDLTNSNTDLSNDKTYISAGGGNSISTASSLDSNTWGFALPNTTSGLPSSNTFDSSYTTVTAESKFTQVPTLGNDILIQGEVGTEGTDEEGEGTGEYVSTASIYYGALATASLNAGKYSNAILYTAFTTEPPATPTMQEFTTAECNALTEATSDNYDTVKITLRDSRDDKTYTIARMKDGNCWMTANLALDGMDTITGEVRTLTPEDSNVTTNRTLATNISNGTASNNTSIQIYSGNANSTTTDCGSYAYCVTSDNKYGNLYNWLAATAGTGTAETNGITFESVCPKGWRLPDNGTASGLKSYSNLIKAYELGDGTTVTNGEYVQYLQQKPLNIPAAGQYVNGASSEQIVRISYWTRDTYNGIYSYLLYARTNTGLLKPQDYTGKASGFSVRCVFYGDDISNLTYMQDMTTDICNKMSEGATKTLLDPRGSYNTTTAASYGIIKAKDGNCWMTSNFNLYNTTIYAASSDLSTGSYKIEDTSNWTGNVYTSPKVHRATNTNYTDQVYYNWTSAVALTDGSTTTQQNQSICPKNWQLPINGDKNTNKSYAMLLDKYEITTGPGLVSATTLGFKYSGFWNKDGSGSESNQGTYSSFWSSTPLSTGSAWDLIYYSSGSLVPQYYNDRGFGFSLRCVAR